MTAGKMRILKVADVADVHTGGMSRTMYGTGEALTRFGVEVDYAFRDSLRTSWPPSLRRFAIPQLIAGLVRRKQEAQGHKYDAVEIHEPIAAGYCAARRLRNSLPPLVVFSYGLEERGHAAELAYRRAKGLPISMKNRVSPYSVIAQAMYAVRNADHVVCSNSQDVGYLIDRGVKAKILTRHQSGVDGDFLIAADRAAAQPPVADRHVRLLFVGSWLLRKGILDLAASTATVMRAHPGVTLTVAGCTAGEAMVHSAFPAELRDRIRVVPKLSSDAELIELYRTHGTLVIPSYFEGQPLVMIEAAAMGLAIVTTRICGMLDFVRDDVEGNMVAPGDADALTRAIERIVGDPDRRDRLGAAARLRAKSHTWHAAAAILLSAYQATISAPVPI